MYERLDKLRAEVERCKKKVEDDKVRLRAAEQKLQEAENSQILADVGALNLSPEQLAEFLKLATSGKLGSAGTANAYETTDEVTASEPSKADTEDDYDLEDIEDNHFLPAVGRHGLSLPFTFSLFAPIIPKMFQKCNIRFAKL